MPPRLPLGKQGFLDKSRFLYLLVKTVSKQKRNPRTDVQPHRPVSIIFLKNMLLDREQDGDTRDKVGEQNAIQSNHFINTVGG